MMKRNLQNLVKTIASTAVVCLLVANVNAQVIVNDNFLDGDPLNTGSEPLESQFFNSSSFEGLNNGPQTPGFLDFATGGSGRSIHTLFAPQTLAQVGDRIEVSIDFTTPLTVGTDEDIRFGLFDTSTSPGFSAVNATGALVNPNGFADEIITNSGNPEPGLNLRGFSGGADINVPASGGVPLPALSTGDLEFRTSDPANGSGRLLTSTAGFFSPVSGVDANGDGLFDSLTGNTLASGTDDATDILFDFPVISPAGGTAQTIDFSIELLANGQVELFESIFGETLTVTGEAFDVPLGRDSNGDLIGDSTTFGTGVTFDSLFLSVTGGAFGSSNFVGEPDNGIDITNVTVEFVGVPEPSSALALLGLLCCAGLKRRR